MLRMQADAPTAFGAVFMIEAALFLAAADSAQHVIARECVRAHLQGQQSNDDLSVSTNIGQART